MFHAKSRADLPGLEKTLSISGLEFMHSVLRGDLPAPPMAETLNYRVSAVASGEVKFRGAPKFEHSNPMGATHGGWYGTVLDSCMACAVMTMVPKGSVYTTLEYRVNILRVIPEGMEVIATGTVDHAGRSTAVAHGEIRGAEDGRLYATGSTTCLIMQPKVG
ncbi:MAG TPA: PaaI family thioesterase [Paracoccaceae bacterium]|nr:PaaI family thioesterase [Paracoccaceae bacterium]